jgi:hypothetical protein
MSMKNSMTPSGIEPTAYRLVAQCPVLFGSNSNSYTISMQSDMCIHRTTHILHSIETAVGQNTFKNLGKQ